ncbi:MAG: biotin--[acetyl-CoA-carboxylase] ligase [Thermodesulfobacteriota bacterium]|nr:biotin--[acetyl-CoA-carboxylase] ligase [Thermodesulfobacteriota bacterium]
MGLVASLPPSSLQHFTLQQELSYRRQHFSKDVADQIFRYGAIVGSVIHHFDRLDRCMDHARGLILDHEEQNLSFPSGTVILADCLENGQGRFGRYWHAPEGGLWLVLVLVNTLLPEISRLYPLAAGVACCEFVRHHDIDGRIQWVNDVRVHGRKIGGILTESSIGRHSGEEYILIGMGINVNNEQFPAELRSIAGSMRPHLANDLDMNQAAMELLAKLSWNIGLLHYDESRLLRERDGAAKGGQGSLLLARWRQLSDTIGRRVEFGFNVEEDPQYEATVLGLAEDGGLILSLADSGTIVEYSGEIRYLD